MSKAISNSLMTRIVVLCLGFQSAEFASAQEKQDKVFPVLDPGGHVARISTVLFTADSKQAITVSWDRTVRFWDAETGELMKTLRPPMGAGMNGKLESAAISPDGKTLAVSGEVDESEFKDYTPIFLIDLEKDQIRRVLKGPRAVEIHALAFSPDGQTLASSALTRAKAEKDAGYVRLWKLARDEPPLVMQRSIGGKHMSFAPDGKHLSLGTTQWLDLATQKKIILTVSEKKGAAYSCAWSPDGKMFATGGNTHIYLFNRDGTERAVFPLPVSANGKSYSASTSIRFTSDSRALLTAAMVIDVATGKVLEKRGEDARGGGGVNVLSPNGERVVSYAGTHFHLWNPKNGEVLASVNVPTEVNNLHGFSPDGKSIMTYYQSLNLSTLEAQRTKLKETGKVPPVKKMGEYELISKGLNAPVTLKRGDKDPIPLGKGGSHGHTFLGKDRAVITRLGNLSLYRTDTGELVRSIIATTSIAGSVFPSPDNRVIVCGDQSRTYTVWNPDHDKPLLHLYFPQGEKGDKNKPREWVVWTPEGYYASSTNGARFLGWVSTAAPDQLLTMNSADQFRKQFHRPDVISRLLEFGSLEKAIEAADKVRGIKTTQTTIEDALPPTVILDAPAITKDGKATVKATAVSQGKFPVLEMQLLLDGRPLANAVYKITTPKIGNVEAAWTVEIPPGQHQLNVVARTQVSTGLSSSHDITYTDASQSKPSLHVLSVGINSYPGDWKLNCAANDAKGIRQVFEQRSAATYRGVSSKLLLDAEATKSNILAELDSLRKHVKPQDVAVIFFAGHGVKGKKGAFYLCPHGTDFADVEKTGISNDEIKRTLAQMQGRILVMLDACHSGASRLDEFARELTDDDCGVIVMCAAMGRETAGEEKKLGHGYFAKAIIDGLGGKADVSRKDGQIYLHHLSSFVIETVQDWSNDEQHPVMSLPMSVRSFALAKPGK